MDGFVGRAVVARLQAAGLGDDLLLIDRAYSQGGTGRRLAGDLADPAVLASC